MLSPAHTPQCDVLFTSTEPKASKSELLTLLSLSTLSYFGTGSQLYLHLYHPPPRRVTCSNWRPCLQGADWCSLSDGVPDSPRCISGPRGQSEPNPGSQPQRYRILGSGLISTVLRRRTFVLLNLKPVFRSGCSSSCSLHPTVVLLTERCRVKSPLSINELKLIRPRPNRMPSEPPVAPHARTLARSHARHSSRRLALPPPLPPRI